MVSGRCPRNPDVKVITDCKDAGVFRILMTEEPKQNNSEKQVATGR